MSRLGNGLKIIRMTKENLGVYQLTSLTTSTSSTTKLVPDRVSKQHLFDCTKREKLTLEQLKICKENAQCYRKLRGDKENSDYTRMVRSEHCDERTSQCFYSCPPYLPRKSYCCLGLRSLQPNPPANLTDDEDFSGCFESSGDNEGIPDNETYPCPIVEAIDRTSTTDYLAPVVEAQPFISCNLLLKVGLPVLLTVVVLLCVLYLCAKRRKQQPSRRNSKTSPSENFDLLDSTDSVTTGGL